MSTRDFYQQTGRVAALQAGHTVTGHNLYNTVFEFPPSRRINDEGLPLDPTSNSRGKIKQKKQTQASHSTIRSSNALCISPPTKFTVPKSHLPLLHLDVVSRPRRRHCLVKLQKKHPIPPRSRAAITRKSTARCPTPSGRRRHPSLPPVPHALPRPRARMRLPTPRA